MKARGKGFLFIIIVLGFIIGSPLLSDSSGSAQAMDYNISGSITPDSDSLSSAYFVGMYGASDSRGYFFSRLNGFSVDGSPVDGFPAQEKSSFSFTASYDGTAPTAYTILAIHDLSNDGVTVGSNSIAYGTTWDSLFYHDPVDPSYTQATFSSLLVGSYIGSRLEQFYAGNADKLGAPMGSNLTLINFSDASFGGSAYASLSSPSSVPEPVTILLLGLGLLGVAGVKGVLYFKCT